MKKMLLSLTLVAAIVVFMGFVNTASAANYHTYEVKSGDTLRTIVVSQLKSPKYYKHLMAYNKLKKASDIKPGLVLKIPYSISKTRYAKLRFAIGDVRVVADKKVVKAEKGMYLLQNYVLVTGDNGKAELELDESSIVRVGSKTKFSLKKLCL